VENLLKSFSIWLTDEGKSENTVKTYQGTLQKFFEWLDDNNRDMHNIMREDVQDYMDHLEGLERSAATIEKAFSAISVYSKFLNKKEIAQSINRVEKEKNHDAPDSLDRTERDQLLKEVERDGDLRNTVIVYTLLHTGIRISELCSLDIKDIQISDEKGSLFVRGASGEIKRVIPLSRELRELMTKYLESLGKTDGPLFISSVNKRISSRGVQYMLKKYDVNPHKLRHTFCAELIQSGVDLAVVAELAGHADVNVTKRYIAEQASSKVEDAINRTFA